MAIAWGVDWSELQHSFGAADDLPEALERLTSSDAGEVAEALSDVAVSVTNNGIYSAAPAVARVVLEVLARPQAVARDRLLSLLAGTCGASYASGLADLKRIRAEAVGEDARLTHPWAEEKPWLLASHTVVAERLAFLLELTRDPDTEVRLEAAHLLALPDGVADRVLPALRSAYAAETDERVRAGLVFAISVSSARSGRDRTGVAAWIREQAHDETLPDSVRAAAVLALYPSDGQVLTERDAAVLRGSLTEQSVAVLSATPWLHHEELEWEQLPLRLVEFYRAPGGRCAALDDLVVSYAAAGDMRVRIAASEAARDLAVCISTGRLGEPVPLPLSGSADQVARVRRLVETMAGLLGDGEPEVRFNVASDLSTTGKAVRWVAEPLVALLDDEERVRGVAVAALARAGDPRAVEPLRDLLGQQECWLNTASGVLDGLRPFAGALIAAVASNLADQDSPLWRFNQEGMVIDLIRWGSDAAGAAEALTRRVEFDLSYRRSTDMRTLGSIGPAATGALPVLSALAFDTDEDDASIAAWACWRISGDPGLAILQFGDRVRSGAHWHLLRELDLLADLGPNGATLAPDIESLLTSDDQFVRVAAARTLWRLTGDAARAVETLTREAATLGSQGSLPNAVPPAITHLAEIGAPARSALPVIEAILADPQRLRRVEWPGPAIIDDAYRTLVNS